MGDQQQYLEQGLINTREASRELARCDDNKIHSVLESLAERTIAAENEIPGANISSISVQRLIVAMHAPEYYTAINRSMTIANMHYTNVLKSFKIE